MEIDSPSPTGEQENRGATERVLMEDRPQVLYRFYGAGDELLYVGISVHAPSRFMQHRDDKPWWTEITSIGLEHFPDRPSVCAAEIEAIRTERPVYNVVHRVRGAEPATVVSETIVAPTLFQKGQVVALAVEGLKTPPVGEVLSCTATRVELALFSWLNGYFGAGVKTCRIADVRAICLAEPMTDREKREAGYTYVRGVLWNMDPLADFQNAHAVREEMP